jgi:TonB family protein
VMPRWIPPTRDMASRSHAGLLELTIDEAGSVAEATVTKPISPAYDQSLKDIARTWRYQPAMRNGQPVRYRILLEIILRPAP